MLSYIIINSIRADSKNRNALRGPALRGRSVSVMDNKSGFDIIMEEVPMPCGREPLGSELCFDKDMMEKCMKDLHEKIKMTLGDHRKEVQLYSDSMEDFHRETRMTLRDVTMEFTRDIRIDMSRLEDNQEAIKKSISDMEGQIYATKRDMEIRVSEAKTRITVDTTKLLRYIDDFREGCIVTFIVCLSLYNIPYRYIFCSIYLSIPFRIEWV